MEVVDLLPEARILHVRLFFVDGLLLFLLCLVRVLWLVALWLVRRWGLLLDWA